MNHRLRLIIYTVLTALFFQNKCLAEKKDDLPTIITEFTVEHMSKMETKYGFAKDGVRINKVWYDRVYPFSPNGFALVRLNNHYGFINTDGEYLLEPGLLGARPFDRYGLAAIKNKAKWGLIDSKRRLIVMDIFDKIEEFQPNGLAILKYDGKYGLVDTLGNVVLPVIYDKVENFDDAGYATIKNGNKFGIVDSRGRSVVAPEHKDKKSAMLALADYRTQLAKPNISLVDVAEINKVAPSNLTVPNAETPDSPGKDGEPRYHPDNVRTEKEERKQPLMAESAERHDGTAPTLKRYIMENLGEWSDFLSSMNLNIPSEEEVRSLIEAEVSKWQVKGEFEPTAKWRERVNETTRATKINELADSIYSSNSQALKRAELDYRRAYESLVDKYCSGISESFDSENLILRPYDADNETFLISTDKFGDFLLPVPLEEAQGFKQEWDKWKTSARATFVPNGEDVALKSVKIGKYAYDSDMDAAYAQVDVDYNFRPVDVADLSSHLNTGMVSAVNHGSSVQGAVSPAKGIHTEKVRISAGNASEVDINIPRGATNHSNTFAVVIANGDYAHASRVAHAENDGRIMTQYLTKTLGIPEKNVLTFFNATYGQMASAISMLQDIGSAYQNSDFNLMFYYVGHGLPDDEGRKSYILPVDIDPRMVGICMPLEKIYADLGDLGAQNVTVMIDACFSGANHGEGMLLPQSMGVALKYQPAAPIGNMIVLTAAGGNETAFPYEEKSHGLFTYWLLKKLQETSGQVTFGELSDYIIDNVKKTSVTVNHKSQTPTVSISPQLSDKWRSMYFRK